MKLLFYITSIVYLFEFISFMLQCNKIIMSKVLLLWTNFYLNELWPLPPLVLSNTPCFKNGRAKKKRDVQKKKNGRTKMFPVFAHVCSFMQRKEEEAVLLTAAVLIFMFRLNQNLLGEGVKQNFAHLSRCMQLAQTAAAAGCWLQERPLTHLCMYCHISYWWFSEVCIKHRSNMNRVSLAVRNNWT